MNASSLLLLSLSLGADNPPPAAAHPAPVVVSTGVGCAGCGPVVPSNCCNPCGPHATLVDWVKSKNSGSARQGLFARFRKTDKPAAHVVAPLCCDPCAHAVVGAPPIAAPGTGGAVIPKDMPKPKDPPKDLPKSDPPKNDPPKGGNPGALGIPPIPTAPVKGVSGTNSPY